MELTKQDLLTPLDSHSCKLNIGESNYVGIMERREEILRSAGTPPMLAVCGCLGLQGCETNQNLL